MAPVQSVLVMEQRVVCLISPVSIGLMMMESKIIHSMVKLIAFFSRSYETEFLLL